MMIIMIIIIINLCSRSTSRSGRDVGNAAIPSRYPSNIHIILNNMIRFLMKNLSKQKEERLMKGHCSGKMGWFELHFNRECGSAAMEFNLLVQPPKRTVCTESVSVVNNQWIICSDDSNKNILYLRLSQACNEPVRSFCSARIKWLDGLPVCQPTYQATCAPSARALNAHERSLPQG